MSTTTDNVIQMRWRPTFTFASRLRQLRIDYGKMVGHRVSQDDMAALLETPVGTYKGWESGNSRPADLIETAQAIYRITGADPAWLLDVAEDPSGGPEGGRDLRNALDRCSVPFAGDNVIVLRPEFEFALTG